MDYLWICALLNFLVEDDGSTESLFSRETGGSLELQKHDALVIANG